MKRSLFTRLSPIAKAIAAWSGRGRFFELDKVAGPKNSAGVGQGVFFDTGVQVRDVPNALSYAMQVVDPTFWSMDWDDFMSRYAAAEYTITKTGTGTNVLTAGDGGLLTITNSAAGGDLESFQRTVANFQMAKGVPFVFAARFQLDDAVNADAVVGLQKINATPWVAPTEGAYFQKIASANVDFKVGNAGVYNTAAAAFVMPAATMITVEIAYDGRTVYYGQNGKTLGTFNDANLPIASAMSPTFALRNNTAVARTMVLDYFMAGKRRG